MKGAKEMTTLTRSPAWRGRLLRGLALLGGLLLVAAVVAGTRRARAQEAGDAESGEERFLGTVVSGAKMGLHQGYVATRGIVTQNGKPVWVEYAPSYPPYRADPSLWEGQALVLGSMVDLPEGVLGVCEDFTTFTAYERRYFAEEYVQARADGTELIDRSAYVSRVFEDALGDPVDPGRKPELLEPTTHVLVYTAAAMPETGPVVIAQYPFDVDQAAAYTPEHTQGTAWGKLASGGGTNPDPWAAVGSVLVCLSPGEQYGEVLYDSPGTFGYRTLYAEYTKDQPCESSLRSTLLLRWRGENDILSEAVGYPADDYFGQFWSCKKTAQITRLWGAVQGVEIDVGLRSLIAVQQDDGTLTSAQGVLVDQNGAYRLPYGFFPSYAVARQGLQSTIFYATPGGIVDDTLYVWVRYGQYEPRVRYGGVYLDRRRIQAAGMDPIRTYNVPLASAFAVVTAEFKNPRRDSMPLEAEQEIRLAPEPGSEQDRTRYSFTSATYSPGRLVVGADGVPRVVDTPSESLLFDSGLVERLSWKDYTYTDIHVFSPDGRLCAEKRGLDASEVLAYADADAQGTFRLDPGRLEPLPEPPGYSTTVNLRLHISGACLPNNWLRVVAINRPTGYIGTTIIRTQQGEALAATLASSGGTGGSSTGGSSTGGSSTGGSSTGGSSTGGTGTGGGSSAGGSSTGGTSNQPSPSAALDASFAAQLIYRNDRDHPMVLGPPNLRIEATRESQRLVNAMGVTDLNDRGQPETRRTNVITFEGAGLTSDEVVAISTQWYDESGMPLPDALPGYTGRLAIVNTDGEARLEAEPVQPTTGSGATTASSGQETPKVAHFEIRPGQHRQLVRLPQRSLTSQHFYVDVTGWTKGDDGPIARAYGDPFESRGDRYGEALPEEPETDTGEAGAGSSVEDGGADGGSSRSDRYYYYRPAAFVPVQVQVFDEEATRTAAELRASLLREMPSTTTTQAPILGATGSLERVYRWVYRPEFHFSLFDLAIERVELQTTYQDETSASALSFDYELHTQGGGAVELPRFGSELDLVWGVGYAELLALVDQGVRAPSVDFPSLEELVTLTPSNQLGVVENLLRQLAPTDFLSLQLYSNLDPGNPLFELDGLPLVETTTSPIVLTRRHRADLPRANTHPSVPQAEDTTCGSKYIDDYATVGFVTTQPAEVRVVLFDGQGRRVKQLAPAEGYAKVGAGEWAVVVDFTSVLNAEDPRITPCDAPKFTVRIEARASFGVEGACDAEAAEEGADATGGTGGTGTSGAGTSGTAAGGSATGASSGTGAAGTGGVEIGPVWTEASDPTKLCVRQTVEFPGELTEDRTGMKPGQVLDHDVDVHTGKLMLSRTDFSVSQGYGPALAVTRTYSNVNDAATSHLGKGWSLGFDQRVVPLLSREHESEAGAEVTTTPQWVKARIDRQRTYTNDPYHPGCFHEANEIEREIVPDEPTEWTSVVVNGVTFTTGTEVASGEREWVAEKGHHATLTELVCDPDPVLVDQRCEAGAPATQRCFRFVSKDGTEYWYRIPRRRPQRFKTIPERMLVDDALVSRIGVDAGALDLSYPTTSTDTATETGTDTTTGTSTGTGTDTTTGTGTDPTTDPGTATTTSTSTDTGGGGSIFPDCPDAGTPAQTRRWYAGHGVVPSAQSEPVRLIRDRYGNQMRLQIDDQGKLTNVIDAVGRTCELDYTGTETYLDHCVDQNPSLRRVRTITCLRNTGTSAEFRAHYCYDEDGYLSKVAVENAPPPGTTGPTAFVETYGYEDQGDDDETNPTKNLNTVTDGSEDGNTVTYGYDRTPGCLATTEAGGPVRRNDVVRSITYPDASRVAYDYQDGAIRTVTAPAPPAAPNGVTTYTLNGSGNPSTIEDPIGRVTTMTWSSDPEASANQDDNVLLSRTVTDEAPGAVPYAVTSGYDELGNVETEITTLGEYSHVILQQWQTRTTARGTPYNVLGSRTEEGFTWEWDYDDTTGCISALQAPESVTTYQCDRGAVTVENVARPTATDYDRTTAYGYDPYGALTTVTRGQDDPLVREVEADARGRVTQTLKEGVAQRTTEYDSMDHPISTTHHGITWQDAVVEEGWSYDGAGRLTSETDRLGATYTYDHDLSSRQMTITRSAGAAVDARTVQYTEMGAVDWETDWEGQTTDYTYDLVGRLTHVAGRNVGCPGYVPGGTGDTTYGYDLADHRISVTDPEGTTVTYTYDSRGRVRTQATTGAPGHPRTYTYVHDDTHHIAVECDESEPPACTTRTLDSRGNVLSSSLVVHTLAANGTTQETTLTEEWQYSAAGWPEWYRDPNQKHTVYAHNDKGQRTAVVRAATGPEPDAEGARTDYHYDAAGNLERVETDRGPVSTVRDWEQYYYDHQDRIFRVTDSAGQQRQYEYDGAGNLTVLRGPGSEERLWTRDPLGQVVAHTDGTGVTHPCASGGGVHGTYCYEYSPNGNLTKTSDARSGTPTVTYTYFPEGQPRTEVHTAVSPITGPRSLTVEELDGVGNATRTIDHRGRVRTYQYEVSRHLLIHTEEPGVSGLITTERTHTPTGELATYTDPRGITETYTYDEAGRVRTIQTPTGTIERGYDGVGNLTVERDQRGVFTLNTYDDFDHVIKTVRRQGATTELVAAATYDYAGKVTAAVDARGTVDDQGIEAAGTYTTRYEYDHRHVVTRADHPTPRGDETFEYNYALRLSQINHPSGSADGSARTTRYRYDQEGRKLAELHGGFGHAYAYDLAGNVTCRQPINALDTDCTSGGRAVTMTYDEHGRLASTTDGVGETQHTYAADESAETISGPAGTVAYEYDITDRIAEERRAGVTWSFLYDEVGNPTSVTSPSGTVTYTYDDAGQLWTTDYTADGRLVEMGYEADGDLT
ncbi:MAG: RHS repeat protein, partial [Polyangiaceae bacterium]|nr:RHS repeat protein [Polyangiaceae bacterium]